MLLVVWQCPPKLHYPDGIFLSGIQQKHPNDSRGHLAVEHWRTPTCAADWTEGDERPEGCCKLLVHHRLPELRHLALDVEAPVDDDETIVYNKGYPWMDSHALLLFYTRKQSETKQFV